MEISFLFLISGIVILIGFLGSLSFEKTKIPDVLLLLLIGIFLGPVIGLVKPQTLAHFAEYFGSFALMVILFEGGMDMDIKRLIKDFGTASILVVLTFILSTFSIAVFLNQIYQWDVMRSLLLGTILGCTSAAIVIPVASRMSISNEMKTVLSIESALSDVLAVVFAVSLIEFIRLEDIGIKAPFHAIASSFSIAIVIGVIAGFFWLKMLDLFKERKYSYMTTLAAILIVFALVDFLGGSGPISILIFGVILGNSRFFSGFLKIKGSNLIDKTIKFFHGEISFFIRTFFFVYLGMMISFKFMSPEYLWLSVALVLIIVFIRYVSVGIIGIIYKEKKSDRPIMLLMLPRGLASAVLATFPVALNITGSEGFIDYTFAVIVMTNILMTIGVFIVEKTQLPKEAEKK